METSLLTNISVFGLGCVSLATLVSLFLSHRRTARVLAILGPTAANGESVSRLRRSLAEDVSGRDFEEIKEATRRRMIGSNGPVTREDRYFQAGYFSEEERKKFTFWSRFVTIAVPIVAGILGACIDVTWGIAGGLFGLAIGFQMPRSYLQRVVDARSEEILYYLPLVIEQLVIGVSSSLDVGPCVKWVIGMADERDSHNAVTELLRHAQHYMKSGASMEEALIEVGRLSGHTELKHVFMSLSQVAKHGGEITRQLQELANSVSAQREALIEGKIKTLELQATGPVGLVFLAFMGTLLTGLGTQLLTSLR